MRKLIMSALAGCVMALSGNLFASDKLIDYVPSGVDGMVSIQVQKILGLPVFKDAVKSNKEFNEEYTEFEAELKKIGLSEKDMPSKAIVFFKQDGVFSGVVAKTTVTEDKLQQLLTSDKFKDDTKLVTKNIKGKKVFELGTDTTAFTYLEPDVLLITDKSLVGQIIDAAKGDNKALLAKADSVNKDALVWFVYHGKAKENPQPQAGPGNPVDGVETVGASLDFTGKDQKDIVLDAEVTCKDEAAASGLGMQANGMVMMMVPMAFKEDPQLGMDASKAIKIETKGNKINAKVSVPKALHDRLIEYSKKMQQKQQPQMNCAGGTCPAPAAPAQDTAK